MYQELLPEAVDAHDALTVVLVGIVPVRFGPVGDCGVRPGWLAAEDLARRLPSKDWLRDSANAAWVAAVVGAPTGPLLRNRTALAGRRRWLCDGRGVAHACGLARLPPLLPSCANRRQRGCGRLTGATARADVRGKEIVVGVACVAAIRYERELLAREARVLVCHARWSGPIC